MRMRLQKLIEIAAVIAVAVLVGIVAFRQAAENRGDELRMAVATMPLGITGAEADAIVGEPPDHVSRQAGVLVTPVTMLAATNSKAAAYGAAQPFTLRTWKRGTVKATVAIDAKGQVAGRWTWR
jgi:hypothetical protein